MVFMIFGICSFAGFCSYSRFTSSSEGTLKVSRCGTKLLKIPVLIKLFICGTIGQMLYGWNTLVWFMLFLSIPSSLHVFLLILHFAFYIKLSFSILQYSGSMIRMELLFRCVNSVFLALDIIALDII